MMDNGFIILYRKLLETSFFKKPNCLLLAIYCLLKANHKDNKIIFNNQEYIIERGSFITGLNVLKTETGLTYQKLRTALEILKNCGFLTIKTTNKFTIITICNYDTYQCVNLQNNTNINKQITNKQQTNNKQITTNNNDNNDNNDNNKKEMNKEKRIFISFENIWNQYPRKDGKKEAERHFKASVKTEQDYADIQKALANYIKSENVKKGFIKNGSTWFNNWQDWVNVEPINNTKPKPDIQKQNFELIKLVSKPIEHIANWLVEHEEPKNLKQMFISKYGEQNGTDKYYQVLELEKELRKQIFVTPLKSH